MFMDPEPHRRQEIQLTLWNADAPRKHDFIPSGFLSVDAAMQIGGLPRGHMVELFGPESSGKSTIALQAIAAAQRAGCQAVYVDAERGFDAAYAARLGVDLGSMLFIQPEGGEQAFRILLKLVQSGTVDLVVIDSLAALSSDSNDPFVHSGLCASFLRRLSTALTRSSCCLLMLNQLRSRVIEIGNGPEETTTGGWSVKLYASIRADIRTVEILQRRGKPFGQRMRMKIVKNRLSPGFKEAQLMMTFGEGFSPQLDLLSHGLAEELIEQDGDDLIYGGLLLGSTMEEAAAYLKQRPRLEDSLRNLLHQVMGLPSRKPALREAAPEPELVMTALVG